MKNHKTILNTLNFFIFITLSFPLFSQINFEPDKERSLPFVSECQAPDCKTQQGIAAGWGVMSPAIVVSGDDQYTFAMYGCDTKANDRSSIQCIELTKNGETITETLNFRSLTKNTAFPPGTGPSDIIDSYQPPLLFKHKNKLILVHWSRMTQRGINIIFVHSVDLRLPAPLKWKFEARHVYVDHTTFNYLGGSIKGDNIFISGWRSGGGANYNRLELINLRYGNGLWLFTGPKPVAVYDGLPGFTPLYPHVLVLDNDEIRVLGTFQDVRKSSPFMDCAKGLRYHNIGEWKGRWEQSHPYEAVWSDRGRHDPCLVGGNEQVRFAYDFLCVGCGDGNVSNDNVYAVYQKRDLVALGQSKIELQFPIRKNGKVVQNNLGDAFGNEQLQNRISFMSMTHLSSSQFVFATNIDQDIYLQVSSDLTNFLDTPVIKKTNLMDGTVIGVGNQIKLGQPNKNGSDRLIPKLHLYHGGTVNFKDNAGRVINNNHRYKFYKAFVSN